MRSTASPDRLVDLDPAASTLLDILVEAGHLDDPMLDQVNDLLLDQQPHGGVIDLQAMRRVVASVLFDHEERLDPELKRILEAEWGLLFG
ncbi:MAG: hypothetical protein RL071_4632 [Pseudomonadota bacterium]|jgi:hypothetical protein